MKLEKSSSEFGGASLESLSGEAILREFCGCLNLRRQTSILLSYTLPVYTLPVYTLQV